MRGMQAAFVVPVLVALAASTAMAAEPVFKDREALALERHACTLETRLGCAAGVPSRRTDRSPDYVGSEMGLAKPSYYGTRRPDDGAFSFW
jgi:hypothetical protein